MHAESDRRDWTERARQGGWTDAAWRDPEGTSHISILCDPSLSLSNGAGWKEHRDDRTHKIRYAEVPTGSRTGGAGIEGMGRLPVRRTCLRADTHRKTQTWRHSRLSISEGGHIRPKTEGLREVERQSKSALAERLSIGNQRV